MDKCKWVKQKRNEWTGLITYKTDCGITEIRYKYQMGKRNCPHCRRPIEEVKEDEKETDNLGD